MVMQEMMLLSVVVVVIIVLKVWGWVAEERRGEKGRRGEKEREEKGG